MSRPVPRRRFLQLASVAVPALAIAGIPARAEAAETEVVVTLSAARVRVGDSVYLQVEVETDGRRIGQPRLLGLDEVGVSAAGSSSGTSIQIGGGSRIQRSTKTFTYVLSPRKAGEFQIGVEVEVDGQTHRPAKKPKLIASGEAPQPTVEQGKANDAPQDADAEVIVWPVVDKASAYVGEQILYELQIWERANGNLTVSSTPTFKDFWSEDLLPPERARRPRAERRFIAGVPYRMHQTLLRALFPQKTGTLTIGGPEIQMQPMVGLFGGGGPPRTFFGRSLQIEVLPLPAEGQPPGFRPNNVGQLTISADVDRTKLRQGEAVRLRVQIAGTGNIALIELPPLPELSGVRSYEPKPETPRFQPKNNKLEGSRVFTQLLVAEQAGELTIPAIELPYFDPSTGSYAVAKTKPITLQVEANPDAVVPSEQPNASEQPERDPDDDLLAPPIAGGELVRVTPRTPWLSRKRWWIGTLSVPGVIGFAYLAGKAMRRFGPDERSRARSKERIRRRTLLNEAASALESGEGFYPKLAELLQAVAVARAGSEGVGLTRDRLMQLLAQRGVAANEIEQLRELLDACDAARFGAGGGDVEQRRAHLERTRALLDKRTWSSA